jgi:RimJ/RimL family protein N-acetyltransferase
MELQTERLLLHPRSYDADGEPTTWDVVDRGTGLSVGTIGFVGREPEGSLVVGYEIANDHRGRGFAAEALIAVLAHVTSTAPAATVIAETEADHVASRRVMEKAGMHMVDVDGPRVRYAYHCAVPSTP